MNEIQRGIILLWILSIVAQADSVDMNLNKTIRKYSEQRIFCLDIGEEYKFKLKDGSYRSILLLSVNEHRDSVIGKIRKADVEHVDGITAEKAFEKPGVYIATLRIIDKEGREDIDFYKVKVFTASVPEDKIPTIFMTYTPTNKIVVSQSVLFRFWVQGVDGESIEVDVGDGTVISDYESYSEFHHKFTSPGIHIVTASSTIEGKSITQKQKVFVLDNKS